MLKVLALGDVDSNLHTHQTPVHPGNGLVAALVPALRYRVLELPHQHAGRLALRIKQLFIRTETAGFILSRLQVLITFPATRLSPDIVPILTHKEQLVSLHVRHVDQRIQTIQDNFETTEFEGGIGGSRFLIAHAGFLGGFDNTVPSLAVPADGGLTSTGFDATICTPSPNQ